MDTATTNLILDVILIVASLWMVWEVRGVGGVMGRTLTFIVIGTVILGVAHLQASLTTRLFDIDSGVNNVIHRGVVLLGFVFLVIGFRQLRAVK